MVWGMLGGRVQLWMWTGMRPRHLVRSSFSRSGWRFCGCVLTVFEVYLDAHPHDLLSGLRKECALLLLEVATRGPRREGDRRRRGEESHQLVPRGRRGILPRGTIPIYWKIKVWGSDQRQPQ